MTIFERNMAVKQKRKVIDLSGLVRKDDMFYPMLSHGLPLRVISEINQAFGAQGDTQRKIIGRPRNSVFTFIKTYMLKRGGRLSLMIDPDDAETTEGDVIFNVVEIFGSDISFANMRDDHRTYSLARATFGSDTDKFRDAEIILPKWYMDIALALFEEA
jgi:hypothetical protein